MSSLCDLLRAVWASSSPRCRPCLLRRARRPLLPRHALPVPPSRAAPSPAGHTSAHTSILRAPVSPQLHKLTATTRDPAQQPRLSTPRPAAAARTGRGCTATWLHGRVRRFFLRGRTSSWCGIAPRTQAWPTEPPGHISLAGSRHLFGGVPRHCTPPRHLFTMNTVDDMACSHTHAHCE